LSGFGGAVTLILLIAGLVLDAFAVLGLCVMRDVFDRLHYVALAGYGALLIGVSILVRESWSMIGSKSLATGGLLVIIGPLLLHGTARSFRTRERGVWNAGIEEEVEEP
jgi:multisubunit Na+/H+ antiporter MnhG subunit